MNLHIELTKTLKPYFKDHFLLAVSGGVDSMALFHLFLHFRSHFDVNFSVVHFHHGLTENEELKNFRFQAHDFVKKECENKEVNFFSNYSGNDPEGFLSNFTQELKSEDQFRQARYKFFEDCLVENKAHRVVLAHHKEDQLETRILRLLRGTGPEGLKAMELISQWKFRPLLNFSKDQLQKYLAKMGGSGVEDPSNENLDPMRNWVRKFWLPELEAKFPGASLSFHRSLDLLVSSLDQPEALNSLSEGEDISISELMALSGSQQKQVLASYMKGQGLKNYGVSHINEILKRLDREEKSHTFRLLGRRWNVDAGRMSVEDPG